MLRKAAKNVEARGILARVSRYAVTRNASSPSFRLTAAYLGQLCNRPFSLRVARLASFEAKRSAFLFPSLRIAETIFPLFVCRIPTGHPFSAASLYAAVREKERETVSRSSRASQSRSHSREKGRRNPTIDLGIRAFAFTTRAANFKHFKRSDHSAIVLSRDEP